MDEELNRDNQKLPNLKNGEGERMKVMNRVSLTLRESPTHVDLESPQER